MERLAVWWARPPKLMKRSWARWDSATDEQRQVLINMSRPGLAIFMLALAWLIVAVVSLLFTATALTIGAFASASVTFAVLGLYSVVVEWRWRRLVGR